ncbi:lipoprotein insertase outer membrane protein LolB [Undibacterium sp. TJN19]|uniref:lipoprotein insertase outer membrane protein LolB n=1 Tax=Undibacterium sp. TJN19 TaxID=3413055 RepID=UPI003BEFFA68
MTTTTRLSLAAVIFPVLVFMTGCASLNTPTAQPGQNLATASTTGTARPYKDQIQISGRITVQYQQAGKPQNLPGSFEWDQNADAIRISLLSPLGQTLARITQNKQGATLEQDGKETRQASNLNQLLQDTLGWPLPVAGLRDWLQGYVAINGNVLTALKPEDQTVESQGWKLRYATWHEAPDFPKRIDLQRYTEQAGDVSIRIVIDQWK